MNFYHVATDALEDAWSEEHEYGSLDELRGAVSLARYADPAVLGRGHYIRTLQSWPSIAGATWLARPV